MFRDGNSKYENDTPARRGYQVIYRERTGPFSFLPHYHGALEVLGVNGARGMVNVEGTRFPVSSSGTLTVLVPPGAVHSIRFLGKAGNYHQVTLRVSMGCLRDMVRAVSRYGDADIDAWIGDLRPFSHSDLTGEFIKLAAHLSLCRDPRWGLRPPFPVREHERALSDLEILVRIMLLLLRTSGEGKTTTGRGSEPLRRIVDVVGRHYSENLDIERLTELCCMSKSHLCRLVRRQMDMTVKDYVNVVRVEQAKSAMRLGERSITRLALMCGYNHPSYFARVFSALEGMPPSRWRRENV